MVIAIADKSFLEIFNFVDINFFLAFLLRWIFVFIFPILFMRFNKYEEESAKLAFSLDQIYHGI